MWLFNIMKKMIKVKEINRRLIGILIIVLFLGITINVSIIESTASSIKAKNTYSISGTVYKYPTGNIAQGVEVLYYDGYGRSFRDFTDSNGRYLISKYCTDCAAVYDEKGSLKRTFCSKGDLNYPCNGMNGIKCTDDTANNMYYDENNLKK